MKFRSWHPALALVAALKLVPAVQAQLPAFSESAATAWWKSRPEQADYLAEAESISNKLLAIQSANGVDLQQISQAPDFLGWLEIASWLNLYPKASGGEFLGNPKGRQAFAETGQNTALRRMFLAHLSPYDDASKACEILCRIQEAEPALLKKLPQAAVALALVWDQPFPTAWPHLWVRKENLPLGDRDPVERFRLFCKLQSGVEVNPGMMRKLLIDAARLTARELMFVIDVPLEVKEIGYILQVNLKDPRRLNDLFPQVPYDTARMSRDDLMWPHGAYKLIEIGKKGGVCADQAYFVTMAGKAQGIPSVLLMGQGTSGGHAWVGYMGSPGSWTLNVARYANGHFKTGTTWDPQTWRRISETQLGFLTGESTKPAIMLRAQLLTQWALKNKDHAFYPRLLGIARMAAPRNLDIWELQADCLAERSHSLESQRAFWEQWAATFKMDPDMRFRGQKALLKLFEINKDLKSADALRAQIITENKQRRFDLAISLAAAPILEMADKGNWEQGLPSCLAILAQHKFKADGTLFYNLVQPFVEQSVQAGHTEAARTVLNRARPLFEINANSTFAVDFKALENMIKQTE